MLERRSWILRSSKFTFNDASSGEGVDRGAARLGDVAVSTFREGGGGANWGTVLLGACGMSTSIASGLGMVGVTGVFGLS